MYNTYRACTGTFSIHEAVVGRADAPYGGYTMTVAARQSDSRRSSSICLARDGVGDQ